MRVVRETPPLFDEIDAAFNVRGRPVIFAWGDKIYAPLQQGELPRDTVHGVSAL